jgi:hypothetical protein
VFAFQGEFLTLFQSVTQPGDPGDGELWDTHVQDTTDVNAACGGFFRRLQHAYRNRMLVRAHAPDPEHDHTQGPPPKKRRVNEIDNDNRLENEEWQLQQLEDVQLEKRLENEEWHLEQLEDMQLAARESELVVRLRFLDSHEPATYGTGPFADHHAWSLTVKGLKNELAANRAKQDSLLVARGTAKL